MCDTRPKHVGIILGTLTWSRSEDRYGTAKSTDETRKVGATMAKDTVGTKTASRAGKETAKRANGEAEVLANIAEMPGPDRVIAERLHAIIKTSAPFLTPRLWYAMPAYAQGDKVVCFFQSASKFKTRYATLGFQHDAHLDEGAMWPVAFALTGLGAAEEERIAALVKKAVS